MLPSLSALLLVVALVSTSASATSVACPAHHELVLNDDNSQPALCRQCKPTQSVAESGDCEKCPVAATAFSKITGECKACTPGSTFDAELGCVPCPVNHYWTKEANTTSCTACPDGFITEQGGARSIALCVTPKSMMYIGPNDVNFPLNTGPIVMPCPIGANCHRVQTTIRSLQLQAGYWRLNADSRRIYRCPGGELQCVKQTRFGVDSRFDDHVEPRILQQGEAID
jgi:hypothetical protein